MFKQKSKFNLNYKIFKFAVITPILISIPFFTKITEAKAGLEFQWDQSSGHKKLKWFQKDNKRRFRNTIYFFFKALR